MSLLQLASSQPSDRGPYKRTQCPVTNLVPRKPARQRAYSACRQLLVRLIQVQPVKPVAHLVSHAAAAASAPHRPSSVPEGVAVSVVFVPVRGPRAVIPAWRPLVDELVVGWVCVLVQGRLGVGRLAVEGGWRSVGATRCCIGPTSSARGCVVGWVVESVTCVDGCVGGGVGRRVSGRCVPCCSRRIGSGGPHCG